MSPHTKIKIYWVLLIIGLSIVWCLRLVINHFNDLEAILISVYGLIIPWFIIRCIIPGSIRSKKWCSKCGSYSRSLDETSLNSGDYMNTKCVCDACGDVKVFKETLS